MRKLFLQCECGQRMRMPRSAVGKRGICPSCGRAIAINVGNTVTSDGPGRPRPKFTTTTDPKWQNQAPRPPEDARRAFGRAADLFCEGHYGEALAIFDALTQQFPSSIEIQNAREQCMTARRRRSEVLTGPAKQTILISERDPERLKEIIFDKLVEKMRFGATDELQLQAANLLGQLLGMFQNGHTPNTPSPETEHNDDFVDKSPSAHNSVTEGPPAAWD